MIRIGLRLVMIVALVAVGWAAGKAQTAEPDFEIVVNAPEGETMIECVRGCELAWVERGVNPNANPVPTFQFSCKGGNSRCSSARVGGWITR
jgi:hypothetical protein